MRESDRSTHPRYKPKFHETQFSDIQQIILHIWTEFDGAGHPGGSSSAVVPISSLPAPARGESGSRLLPLTRRDLGGGRGCDGRWREELARRKEGRAEQE